MPSIIICERTISLQKAGTGIHPGWKESFFYPGSCSNIGSEPFFIREILDMTGIDIEKIGDPNALCFEIHIPSGGYRFFRRIFFKEKAPGPRPFPRLIL